MERTPAPTSLRRLDEARRRHGRLADDFVAAMWRGDPLADAFAADVALLGHGRALRMLRTACRRGIDAVPEAPDSLRALVAAVDDVPDWVDVAAIEAGTRDVARYSMQAGIVLGAASLVNGYANATASRPLEFTGRYVENPGARTIEVGSWLVAINRPGGLERHSEGIELTVRVRVIHALVRASLDRDPRWDHAAWGLPIPQSYLAYTLVEFALIPLRALRRIGAAYLPHEEAATYARWRYLGHVLGIDPALLPRDAAEQERIEDLYLLTRPPVDDYCRDLVAGINREFLVPEVAQALPGPMRRLAPHLAPRLVAALERLFLGDDIADELAVPRTRLLVLLRALLPPLALLNRLRDRSARGRARRAARGRAHEVEQEERLRSTWGVRHDLVDASPAGGRPHPARGA